MNGPSVELDKQNVSRWKQNVSGIMDFLSRLQPPEAGNATQIAL
jgi:hypothetical protein